MSGKSLAHCCRYLLIPCLTLVLLGTDATARVPLLQDGKTSLYQRVLTRHGAELQPRPDQGAATTIGTFSRLYVYDRDTRNGARWLEVGNDSAGAILGWVREDQTVPWRQQLCLVFADRKNRERTLVFNSAASLTDLLNQPRPDQITHALVIDETRRRADPRIVSIEPEGTKNFEDEFYLLPILEHRDTLAGGREPVKLLRIIAVTDPDRGPPPKPAGSVVVLRSFRGAVVFVVDATASMGPYIQAMKDAIRKLQSSIESKNSDALAFGLIAYRGDPATAPQLEYATRRLVDPSEPDSAARFRRALDTLTEAQVSTGDHFTEDALAGIDLALQGTQWETFDARYIILVTDAAAFENGASVSGKSIDWAVAQAQRKDIAFYVLHLVTPEGAANHALARDQYRRLSTYSAVNDHLYFDFDFGGTGHFQDFIDALAKSLITNVQRSARGETGAGAATVAAAPPTAPVSADPAQRQLERLRQLTSQVGRVQVLDWLGAQGNTQIPLDFEGWIADKDFNDPATRVVDVRVLLTRNQFSDIATITEDILASATRHLQPASDFFSNLKQLAVDYSTDPNRLAWRNIDRLGDHAVLRDYLDDLPYQSEVLKLRESIWASWGETAQRQFIDRLQWKLDRYRFALNNPDVWIPLAQGAPPDEHVYPVPLEMLP